MKQEESVPLIKIGNIPDIRLMGQILFLLWGQSWIFRQMCRLHPYFEDDSCSSFNFKMVSRGSSKVFARISGLT